MEYYTQLKPEVSHSWTILRMYYSSSTSERQATSHHISVLIVCFVALKSSPTTDHSAHWGNGVTWSQHGQKNWLRINHK